MPNVTRLQLWEFLSNAGAEYATFEDFVDSAVDADEISFNKATFDILKAADLKNILAGSEMSENHLGGDDLVSLVNDILAAQQDGYVVVT
jgi:hypothetical protein